MPQGQGEVSHGVTGWKDQSDYNPVGLIARSQGDGGDGMIHVAINYRLGLFGFVHGGDDERIEPNAGLLDQRLALQWYVPAYG